jgi:DNA-binding CsgD family transcriptional regulator
MLNRGVVIIDSTRLVVFVNHSARAMFERTACILVRRGRFELAADEHSAALKKFLLETSVGPALRRSLVFRLLDRASPIDYRVLVSLIGEGTGASTYVVFIYEPRGGARPLPILVLRDLYGLTAQEARLTNLLFSGHSLCEAAVGLGVSANTAKSALKRIFAKCEVCSQGELLQLLALGPRTL